MAKGGAYERDFCWSLSRWWYGHSNKLGFWRTSNSGGGATVRKRKGIANQSHAGDITAIEEDARPFTNLITIECKRGYNKTANVHSLLDFKRQTKKRKPIPPKMYEQWIEQAVRAAETAGTKYWMLIHRRDGGEEFCFFPNELLAHLARNGTSAFDTLPRPMTILQLDVRFSDGSEQRFSLVGMKWKHFLFHVDPDDIRSIS